MTSLHRRTHQPVDDGTVDRTDRYAEPGHTNHRTDSSIVDDRTTMTSHQGWNSALRAIGALVSAIAIVIGVVALFRLDWNAGLDAPPVDVLGIAFDPAVAIATVVAGVIALVAAATADRTSKLIVGAILVCVGIGIVVAGPANQSDLGVEDAHGWLALVVGAVLILEGLALRASWSAHRQRIENSGYAH